MLTVRESRRMWAFPLVFSAVLAVSACTSSMACVGVGAAAISVEIRDSVTGLPAAYQARLILRNGAFTDTLTDFSEAKDSLIALNLAGGMDRPGTYSVRVERSGYAPWTKDGVLVAEGKGDCASIHGVELAVRLQRIP